MVVAHVTKYKSNSTSSGALGRHIDREHIPENAEAKDQDKNFCLVTPGGSLKDDIQNRINEGYKGKKKLREDAIRAVGVIFSGSNEQMKKIEKADLIDEWAKDTYDFACERWGKENIIRATVHMDEKTPHMHLWFVPLTEDGRLSAKEITSRKNLFDLQDEYALKMNQYGLERGQKKSKEKHVTTAQYYERQQAIKQGAAKVLEGSKEEIKEAVTFIFEEYEKLTGERKKEQQKKINPDKSNSYAKPRREISEKERKQDTTGRRDKGADRGPNL